MKRKRNIDLELAAKRVLKATAGERRSTQYIADSPDAFDGVMRAIKSIRTEQNVAELSGKGRIAYVLRAAAACAVLLAAAIALSNFYGSELSQGEVSSHRPAAPASQPAVVRPKTPPESVVVESELTTGRTSEERITPQRAAARPMRKRMVASAEARGDQIEEPYSADFYPITYAGEPYETARGGRVIRVDVPRSTLFAMGADVSLEDPSQLIKADLLVGPDGITRGIRLVR